MGGLLGFLFIYILGGITFLPLLLVTVLLHAYLTFPVRTENELQDSESNSIVQPGDDVEAIERAQQTLGEKFRARNPHEADVAAGYFAVCREYVPGGVNGKPPERTTPVGSTPVASPSPSVYQSMYRSLFERKPVNGPLDNKKGVPPQKRGGNVFYVVLRHGHLMLFDDDEQLEVRHVISLAHHNVSIYSGEEDIPEGELFIKRNALCLSRRLDAGEVTVDGAVSKPFFLFSENCSDKEDFYFALLRNQERRPNAKDNPPIPLQYEVKDVITLVQRLHSSEEHLQTRWINAVIGRVFLALYKTTEVENYIRSKITKKISRVKTPSFLSQISLQKIDLGEAAPVITNPRLKDLTVDGELVVEADVKYSGNFRLEVAAIARLELGTRFKAREVNLLLAVVLKRIEGHALIRIKPPPSNRFWVTFETMPKIDLHIEPIVSSRQITYTIILRQIESRIKEVVAESLVLPHWDDSPFFTGDDRLWRGGIWANSKVVEHPLDPETAAAQRGDVDEVEQLDAEHEGPVLQLTQEGSLSMPTISTPPGTAYARKAAKSAVNLSNTENTASSSGVESRAPLLESRQTRSGSLVSASSPVVGTDVTNAGVFKPSTPPDASHAMAAMAALSNTNAPPHTPIGSPRTGKLGSRSSASSRESELSEKETHDEFTPQPSTNGSEKIAVNNQQSSIPSSPASIDGSSLHSEQSTRSFTSFGSFGRNSRRDTASSTASGIAENRKISLAALNNVANTAKEWGWNTFQKRTQNKSEDQSEPPASPRPLVMGRGQPLPPPGVPLPRPSKSTKTAPIPVPKRKPIPPPILPSKQPDPEQEAREARETRRSHPLPPPILPKRRSRESAKDSGDDGLLVVSAPADSEPTTPAAESSPSYVQPWVEDEEPERERERRPASGTATPEKEAPRLPKRRPPPRVLSSSPEEDGQRLPTWLVAQEEEARAKANFVDEDAGLQ